MGMDPVQWVFLGLELIGNLTLIRVVIWLFQGGWKFILRTFGFDIDTLLVNVIARVYDYFLQLLNGELFNDEVVSALLTNVYVFVGVIMFFRLLMLIIKYLVDPDLVSDKKLGVNSLIKRVIIGLMGILFIPTLFDWALELQGHILQDNIIQQIVVPSDMLDAVKNRQADGGKYIGTYVLAGFISPGENASNKTKKEYENALEAGDLSGLSTLRKDGFLVGEYEYDYFYFLSTFCLCYVLYIMIKYALDVLTRFLRMLMYQLLAPVAMIEYMINGSDDGIFKSWKNGILGTYFMLFVRVLALWFVVFITILMSSDKNNLYVKGSLLATDDYLLRAFIIIAVIGFMQDLPKLMGQVFGLDFEQEGHGGGILKQVGGMLKGVAMGALAIGGAAVGGAIGTAKAGFGMTKTGKKWNQGKRDLAKKNPELMGLQKSLKNSNRAFTAAIMGSNSITGGMYKSYSGVRDSNENIRKERDNTVESNQESNKAKEKEERKELQSQKERKEDVVRNVTERVVESMPKDANERTIKARVEDQMFGNSLEMSAIINGKLNAMSTDKVDTQTITQEIHQVLKGHMDIAPEEVEQRVHQVISNPSSMGPPSVEQVVQQVVQEARQSRVQADEQVITQVVNQVYGTRVNNVVDDATQTITQKIDQQIDVTRNIHDNISQSVDIQRNINDSVSQSVEIQKDIRLNTEEINAYTGLTAENTEILKNKE